MTFDLTSGKTLEEKALLSILHAEMLFVRGMAGPQVKDPDEQLSRNEMGICLVEAGKVLQKGASMLAIKPDEPRRKDDDERRRLCTNFLMTSNATFIFPRLGDYSTWVKLIMDNINFIDDLYRMYLDGEESLFAINTVMSFEQARQMIDLCHAFRIYYDDLGDFTSTAAGGVQRRSVTRSLKPFIDSWLDMAPMIHRNSAKVISNIWNISVERMFLIIPVIDSEEIARERGEWRWRTSDL